MAEVGDELHVREGESFEECGARSSLLLYRSVREDDKVRKGYC